MAMDEIIFDCVVNYSLKTIDNVKYERGEFYRRVFCLERMGYQEHYSDDRTYFSSKRN